MTSRIQKTRKDAQVNIDDKITIVLEFPESSNELREVFTKKRD